MTNLEKQLQTAVQLYFDGLYEGDVEKFAQVFHPRARLFSATEGELFSIGMEEYFTMVAGRASPASRGDQRMDEIVSMTVVSPTMAHARVRDVYLPKHFIDDLGFLHLDGRWQIVSKIFHFKIN